MSSTEFAGVLDLSGANTSGPEALDSGTYDFELFDYKVVGTKAGGKLPEGSPLYKLQFKCIEGEWENRRVFDQFAIPPSDYDKDARETMLGMLARFLMAMGLDEKEVKSKKFNLNDALTNLIGHPVKITVEKVQKYDTKPEDKLFQNNVKGYKAIDTTEASSRVL